MGKSIEKSPLESKKFIAYLLAEATWKVVLLVTLWVGRGVLMEGHASPMMWGFMLAVVIVAGFIEAGFIGGQTWLDKYVRVAQIAARQPSPEDSPTDG